jgi:hypothetical protein
MAAPGTLNAAFVAMGFGQDAANLMTDAGKENIDITNLQFYDDKGVKTLCASLRKPGGLMQGPAAADGTIPMVVNPGVYVSTRAELNLASASYMARHYIRTKRTIRPADLRLDRLVTFQEYREAEDSYTEPSDHLKLTKPDKIIDFIDDWPDNLALFNGQNGRPLAYVIREKVEVPEDDDDPAFGRADTVYSSIRDEIIARGSHTSPQFQIDNAKVFELLSEAIADHKHVKTWIKSFLKSRNGRGAWIAFKAHYRGSNEVEAIEANAEKILDTVMYRGEKPKANFETHVSLTQKAHMDIERKTGVALTERAKV